jgi:uncharacterized phage protein (TIGR01671 family)
MKSKNLFKGKRIDNGEWVEGFYGIKGEGTEYEQHFIMQDTFNSNTTGYPFYFTDVQVDAKTVRQYIGKIEDADMFQGDIIQCNDPNDGREYISSVNANMVGGMYFENRALSLSLAMYCYGFPENIKIIGNIYDNPELLETAP